MGDFWFQAYDAVWEDLQEALHLLRTLSDHTVADEAMSYQGWEVDQPLGSEVYNRIEKLTDKYESWEIVGPDTAFVRYDWPEGLSPAASDDKEEQER